MGVIEYCAKNKQLLCSANGNFRFVIFVLLLFRRRILNLKNRLSQSHTENSLVSENEDSMSKMRATFGKQCCNVDNPNVKGIAIEKAKKHIRTI